MTADTIEIEPVPLAYHQYGPLLRKKDVVSCITAAGVPADLLRWGDEYQPFPNSPEGFLPMCAVSMTLDHLLAPVARLLRPEGLH